MTTNFLWNYSCAASTEYIIHFILFIYFSSKIIRIEVAIRWQKWQCQTNFSHYSVVPVLCILQSTFSEFVPLLVELCTNIVELRGLDITGIYRVPGNTAVLSSLTEGVNKGFDSISLQVYFVMNFFSSPQLSLCMLYMQHAKWLWAV